ncbi:hypothetical protein HZB60_02185 [candidate division KSB1 bacterium]|nr:hypothetical protein [candidate division KSB1 bacterium]
MTSANPQPSLEIIASAARDAQRRVMGMSLVGLAVQRQHDLLEYFVPLVKKAIADLCQQDDRRVQMSTEQIRDHIREQYCIVIPLVTVQTLLRRLEQTGVLRTFENGKFVEVSGDLRIEELDAQDRRARSINELIQAFQNYCKATDVSISDGEARVLIVQQFRNHAVDVAALLLSADESQAQASTTDVSPKLNREFADFFREIRTNNERLYGIARDLYLSSSLLAVVELRDNLASLPELKSKVRVFLDTNFLLRLLNWQTVYECAAAQELFDALTAGRASVCVYSFTIAELRRVLEWYGREALDLLDGPVRESLRESDLNGVVSAVHRRRLSRIDFERSVDNLEGAIGTMGLSVIQTAEPGRMNLESTEIESLVNGKRVSKFKSGKTDEILRQEAMHDVAAVHQVRRARGGEIGSFKEAQDWFLTCDRVLHRWNREAHRANGTIPEVIMDYSMTNLLWIANPQELASAGIDHFLSNVSVGTTYDTRTLHLFQKLVRNHAKETPGDLPVIEFAYRTLRSQEDREELLQAQSRIGTADLESVIREKIDKSLREAQATRLREEDERGKLAREVELLKSQSASTIKDYVTLKKASEEQSAEVAAELQSSKNELVSARQQLDREREARERTEADYKKALAERDKKERELRETRLTLRFRQVLIASISLTLLLSLFTWLSDYSGWFRLVALAPVAGYYVWYKSADTVPTDRTLRIFANAFNITVTLIHIWAVFIHATAP